MSFFELSIIRKYLLPEKKNLSVALMGLLSVGIISLVVWLVLVFLSVTEGIERSWMEKLTALNAPLRIQPTPLYFNSYYYRIDEFSSRSNYTAKSIRQKLHAVSSDPYDPETDAELPSSFPLPDKVDPVKGVFACLAELKGKIPTLEFQEYEIGGALLRLNLVRDNGVGTPSHTLLTQVSYLASFSPQSKYLSTLLIPPSEKEINQLHLLAQAGEEIPLHDLPHAGSPSTKGKPLFLAKSFQDGGVRVGDSGYLAYQAATTSAVQEMRLPVYVAGFYDPGIMAAGSKYILAPPEIVRTINAGGMTQVLDKTLSSGVQVWFKEIKEAPQLKKQITDLLEKQGLSSYWKVTTFYEYDFAKEFLQQFQSDRYLFTLVGMIILIVACTNIISLLLILVHNKKREIGILQALGTPVKSIALIFGGCGMCIGLLSSLAGVGAAVLTLSHLDKLVQFLSFLQGHDAFSAAFYGSTLPNTLSIDALTIVLIATPLVSFLAGLIPALKASRMRPSALLRSET